MPRLPGNFLGPTYPLQPQPVTPIPDPAVLGQNTQQILAGAIPGLGGLTQSASSNVGQLMQGLPSAGPTQRANAYFGATSGMPGSDFVRNRGFDLYGEKSEGYKQRGFDDFLQLLRGVSGTIAPTTGEQIQDQQYNQNLQQRQIEGNRQAQQFNAQFNRSAPPTRSPDSYIEYNTLGMKPLFGRGSGRI